MFGRTYTIASMANSIASCSRVVARCAGRVSLFLLMVIALAARAQPASEPAAQPASQPPSQLAAQQAPPAAGPKPAPSNPSIKAVPASRLAKNIVVVTIHDPIDRITATSISRRFADAQAAGADLIVIEINTPGGEVGAVLDICSTIKQSPIRTVAWINTQAYSGGALVALACNEIIVSDPVSMGDAKPIGLGPMGAKSIDKDMLMKILPPLIGSVVDSAQRRNRAAGQYVYDELLVQGIIVSDAELWEIENTATGQRMCVTGAEFRMLFPDLPMDGTPMLAGASSVSRQNLPPRASPLNLPPPSSVTAPNAPVIPVAPAPGDISFVGASPAAEKTSATVGDAGEGLLSVPSLRPKLSPADTGKWKFIGKVSGGTGPLVFNAQEMAYFGFAQNLDSSNALDPIRNDADLKAYFSATTITRLDQSWVENAIGFLSNPIVRGILIVIFLVGIFIEGSHPGLFVPGIIGGLALILLVAPPLLTGFATWWAAAAILAGLACIGLELFVVPGTMVAGLIGFVLLFGGLVGTFVPTGGKIPGNSMGHDISLGLATVVLSMGTALLAMFFLGKYFGSMPLLKRMVLPNPDQLEEEGMDLQVSAVKLGSESEICVGAVGVAISPLRPTGTIEIGDQVLDASVELGFVSAGSTVRIVKVMPGKVIVAVVKDGPPPPPIADMPIPSEKDIETYG